MRRIPLALPTGAAARSTSSSTASGVPSYGGIGGGVPSYGGIGGALPSMSMIGNLRGGPPASGGGGVSPLLDATVQKMMPGPMSDLFSSVAEGVAAAPAADQEKLRESLNKMTSQQMQGLMPGAFFGPISFSANIPAPPPAAPAPAATPDLAPAAPMKSEPDYGDILKKLSTVACDNIMSSAEDEKQETPPPDLLFSLLMTQRVDGSFPLSDLLRFWLPDRWPQVKQAVTQDDEALVATTLMVALLPIKAADRKAEWQPAMQKAQRWLKQQTTSFDPLPFLPT